MRATDVFAARATLARSVRLLGEFRFAQSDPARFYGALADDTGQVGGVEARVVALSALIADKSADYGDPDTYAKDRADLLVLSELEAG